MLQDVLIGLSCGAVFKGRLLREGSINRAITVVAVCAEKQLSARSADSRPNYHTAGHYYYCRNVMRLIAVWLFFFLTLPVCCAEDNMKGVS